MISSYGVPALVALGWLAGCAMVYEGKYDWDEGWRVGRVLQFGPGMAMSTTTHDDCRVHAVPADVTRTVYAEVAYNNEGRWLRNRVAPVAEGMAIVQGQTVYINVRSCESV